MKGVLKIKKSADHRAFKIKIPAKDSGKPKSVNFYVKFKNPEPPTPDPCLADDFITKYVLLHWHGVLGIFDYISTAVGILKPGAGSNGVKFYQDLYREYHQLDTNVNHRLIVDGNALITFSGSGDVHWDGNSTPSSSGYVSGSGDIKNIVFSGAAPERLYVTLESGSSGVNEISLRETYVSNGFPVVGNEIIDDPTFTYPSEEFMYLEEFPGPVSFDNIGWGEGYNEYILYPIRE